jgi:hypothetical protein
MTFLLHFTSVNGPLYARCKSPRSLSQQPAVDPRRARTAITSDLSRHLLRQHGSTDGGSR